jgi:hypothetical protein
VLYLRALVASLRGCVFHTDPILPDGTLASVDSTDADLNALRTFVDLAGLTAPSNPQALRELKGRYVELRETSAPAVSPPTVTPPSEFVYDVRNAGFTAVNAYHHCDWLFRMVEGMGIDVQNFFDGTTFPVPVDHYALGNQVNAQAPGNQLGNGSGGFLFGLARAGQPIGIATTARVVLHEFGHALLWDHVDSPNFGFAHSAGDSLAVTCTIPACAPPTASIPSRSSPRRASGSTGGTIAGSSRVGPGAARATTRNTAASRCFRRPFRLYRAIGGDSADVRVQGAAARYVAFLIIKAIGTLSFMTAIRRSTWMR